MSDAIKLSTITTLDLPVKEVLKAALKHPELDSVLVIGYEVDGSLYVASSSADMRELHLMSCVASNFLLKQFIEGE